MIPVHFSLTFLFLFLSLCSYAQSMTAEKLLDIIQQEADTVSVQGNSIQFLFNEGMLVCIYDENANRMRIISPIVEREKLGEEELLNALVANFHSVLDVKYALSDEIVWSVYAHPLKELTERQVIDAIQQVYARPLLLDKPIPVRIWSFREILRRKKNRKHLKFLRRRN